MTVSMPGDGPRWIGEGRGIASRFRIEDNEIGECTGTMTPRSVNPNQAAGKLVIRRTASSSDMSPRSRT